LSFVRRVKSFRRRFAAFGIQPLDICHASVNIAGTFTNQTPWSSCSLLVFTFEQYSSASSQKMVLL